MTADHMNSPHNRDKLPHHIQGHYLQNEKIFSQCFFAFSKSTWNFENFQTKTKFIAQIFWKLLTPKNVLTWMPESTLFRTPFGNQRVHSSQILTNSAWRHFFPNFTLIWNKIKFRNISANYIWDLRTVW